MSAPAWLMEGGIYLAAAVVAVPLSRRLGLGAVLGYLIAGIVIGPSVLGLIDDPERVLHFAEFGVVLLLFLVGLELDPDQVWRLRKALLGLGGAQVVLTIAVAAAIEMLFGISWPVALVAAMGIAMSSTAIGLASLEERRLLATPGGQASFAVLLFQDLAVIPLFLVLALLAPDAGKGFDPWAIVKAVGVIAAIVVASRTVVRPLMRIVAQTGLREIFIAFSLLLVVGVSLAVQAVGLSMALGTFLAGVLLADSEYRYQLQLDIEPAKGLLLGLFFIAVGMSVDLALVLREPVLIIGLALAVVAGKAVVLLALARVYGLPRSDSLLFTVALAQVGEFAFVLYGLGLAQGTLDRPTYDVLNAVVALSMLATPLAFVLYDRLTARRLATAADDTIDEKRPVIVAGFGRFGQMVVRVLNARGIDTTLIDHDPGQVELMRGFGWRCYYGDAARPDLLEQAGIAQARLLVLAIDDPQAALAAARLVQQRWPTVRIVVRARSRTDAFELRDLGLHPIRETFESSLLAAREALEALGESPHAAWRMVRQFARHDADLLEQARGLRQDRAALLDLTQRGRQDLQSLLARERGDAPLTEQPLEDGWAHLHPPDRATRDGQPPPV